jgi:Glycosyl hydrolase catalytic core
MMRRLKLAGAVVMVGCLVAGTVAAAPVARPAAATVTRAGKGVSAWVFDGVNKALAKSGASWYYTWAPDHPGITSPRGVHFVPMIWGAGSVTPATLHEVRHEGPDLLGFNEPDMASQSNMSVSQALGLWPRLMATGLKLGSPAVATNAATPGGWLDQFMHGVRARHLRVNFITVHWYGGDFATGPAVQQLRSYLQAIHARYRLPIWLTEFALIRFGPTTFPSARAQAAFLTAATSMLGRLSFVHRYAWFALPATSGDGTAGLFRPGAIATRAGRAFEAAGAATGLR